MFIFTGCDGDYDPSDFPEFKLFEPYVISNIELFIAPTPAGEHPFQSIFSSKALPVDAVVVPITFTVCGSEISWRTSPYVPLSPQLYRFRVSIEGGEFQKQFIVNYKVTKPKTVKVLVRSLANISTISVPRCVPDSHSLLVKEIATVLGVDAGRVEKIFTGPRHDVPVEDDMTVDRLCEKDELVVQVKTDHVAFSGSWLVIWLVSWFVLWFFSFVA